MGKIMLAERNESGFTLIELIVVVVVVGIVSAIAVPSFTQLIRNNQITSTTNSVSGIVSFARQEAVRSGRLVQITPAGANNNWNDGFAVAAGGVNVRVLEDLGPLGVTAVRGNAGVTAIGFAANGMTGIVNNAGITPGDEFVITLCHQADSAIDGRQIIINAGGQVMTRRGVDCS